jgi:hypothetical protein
MLQRLLDTTSLTGGQWGTVLALSLIAPAIVGVDKAIQLRRQRKELPAQAAMPAGRARSRAATQDGAAEASSGTGRPQVKSQPG